jgi:hypothetical protein
VGRGWWGEEMCADIVRGGGIVEAEIVIDEAKHESPHL